MPKEKEYRNPDSKGRIFRDISEALPPEGGHVKLTLSCGHKKTITKRRFDKEFAYLQNAIMCEECMKKPVNLTDLIAKQSAGDYEYYLKMARQRQNQFIRATALAQMIDKAGLLKDGIIGAKRAGAYWNDAISVSAAGISIRFITSDIAWSFVEWFIDTFGDIKIEKKMDTTVYKDSTLPYWYYQFKIMGVNLNIGPTEPGEVCQPIIHETQSSPIRYWACERVLV